MAIKKNPWDDVVQFDDWNKEVEEDVKDDEDNSNFAEISVPQEIQGLGIKEEDDVDLNALIRGLNEDNATYTQRAIETEKEEQNKRLSMQLAAEEAAKAEKNRIKFEEESAERDRIAFEEAEALAKAEREKRERSLRTFTNRIFSKKPKKDKKIEEREAVEQAVSNEEEALVSNASAEVEKEQLLEETLSEPVSSYEENVQNEVEEEHSLSDNEPTKAKSTIAKRKPHSSEKKKSDVTPDGSNADATETDPLEAETIDLPVEAKKLEENEKLELPQDKVSDENEIVKEEEEVSVEANQESDDLNEREPAPAKEKEKSKKPFFLFGKKKKENSAPQEQTEKNMPMEKESQQKPDWEFLATHDELTGLLNQRAYEEQKDTVRNKPYAVVYVDVNNLKYANDTMGHAAGNKLIVATSDKMKELFPGCTYRIGGDEFVAVVEYSNVKKIENDIVAKRDDFNNSLLAKTKEERESGLIYSASFGYAYTDGSKSFEEVSAEADKAMYAAKEAYKKANPQFDMRGKKSEKKAVEKAPVDYDSMLTKDQRTLKKTIQDNHKPVSVCSTQQIIRDVQTRASEVIAILIASPTFDQLFIILRPEEFINIVTEMEAMVDYSYLYILYEGGPQYKGSDEYLSEVTHIFEAIGNGIKTGKIRSEKDFQKIKGINVFKTIYVDM